MFNRRSNPFQQKLKKDQKNIRSEKRIFVSADKTTNFYKMDPAEYKKLLEKNVMKEYKKN